MRHTKVTMNINSVSKSNWAQSINSQQEIHWSLYGKKTSMTHFKKNQQMFR